MASFATFFTIFLCLFGIVSCQLSANFYRTSCPRALSTIKTAVNNAVRSERRMGASLLRLHFHDCFVNGCDGSILLDDTPTFTGEKTARPNANSVRGFNVIDSIKSTLETQCKKTVSCSDILALAARDSVVALGGIGWTVLLGREDAKTASLSAANTDLPSPFSSLSGLITSFANKGFNEKEMVALSGSHTIGQARCSLFRNRIYNEKNIDPAFAKARQANCPATGGDTNLAPLDGTPNTFDNTYFRDLVKLKGLLHSDQVLFNNDTSDATVRDYSFRPITFLRDFADAMFKMSNMGPLTGGKGEIRTICSKIN